MPWSEYPSIKLWNNILQSEIGIIPSQAAIVNCKIVQLKILINVSFKKEKENEDIIVTQMHQVKRKAIA